MKKFIFCFFSSFIFLILPVSASTLQNTFRELNIEYGLIIQLNPNKDSSATTKLAAKVVGSEIRFENFTHKIKSDGKIYTLFSSIEIPKAISLVSSLDKIIRQSSGIVTNGGLQGLIISEKRGSKMDLNATSYLPSKKKVTFLKNNQFVKELQIEGNVTDMNSLPYLWVDSKFIPNAISINLLDAKKIYKTDFISKKGTFVVNNQRVPIIQFTKVKKDKEDSELTITVREIDGYPVRIDFGLSAKEGVKMSIFPIQTPKPGFKF
jgi:hypothetical protein